MMSTGLRRVIVADDHAIVRQGTVGVLGQVARTEIVAEVADGLQAIAEVKRHQPDLLVLDSAMPHARGIEVLADTRRWSPDTSIVLFTGFTSAAMLASWLDAEVEGVLLKSCEAEEMVTCFETVLSGGRFICQAAQEILEAVDTALRLTDREREVLSLLAMGLTSPAIADRLCISARTVEKHRAGLMNKVGVNSIGQLIGYALREGLLDDHRQL
jgi:DNA-binding NarL/FixJ family response regulator